MIFALHLHRVLGYIERAERFKYEVCEGFIDCIGARGLERKEIEHLKFWELRWVYPKETVTM